MAEDKPTGADGPTSTASGASSDPASATTIATLQRRFPRPGRLVWIGLRPARLAAPVVVAEAELNADLGLAGDHYASRGGKRQVTLIQAEHLAVIGELLGEGPIDPRRLRRNLVVSGINLLALKDRLIRIGVAVLRVTVPASPCARMERELGAGGYNAMRDHGGVCAYVLRGGAIRVGDPIHYQAEDAS